MFLGLHESRLYYVDPETYRSPSGAYTLKVTPSEPQGGGPCSVTLTLRGKAVWSKKMPYLVSEVTVDNDGDVGACGAESGFGYHTSPLHTIIFDPTGKTLCDRTVKRHMFALDAGTLPAVGAFAPDPLRHRLAVELDDLDQMRLPWQQQWTLYDLRTGRVLRKRESGEAGKTWLTSRVLTLVAGTEQFAGYDSDHEDKVTVSLCDGMGNEGASVSVPLSMVGGEAMSGSLKLVSNGPKKLLLRSERSPKQVELDLDEKPDGSLAFRQPKPLTVPIPKIVAEAKDFRTVSLRPTGQIHLSSVSQTNWSMRLVEAVRLGETGFLTLNFTDDRRSELRRFDSVGNPVGPPIPVPSASGGSYYKMASIDPGHCLLLTIDENGAKNPNGLLFALDKQTFSPWSLPEHASQLSVGSFLPPGVFPSSDGMFVSIDKEGHSIQKYDRSMKLVWEFKTTENSSEAPIYNVNYVAPYGDGGAAIVDPITNKITILDGKGQFKKSWNLEGTIQYANRLAEMPNGGIAVDSFGNRSIVVVGPDGHPVAKFKLHYPDGTSVEFLRGLTCDKNGQLWGADDYGVFQISKSGLIENRVGQNADSGTVGEISQFRVGPVPRIVLTDQRTEAIHAFDLSGRSLYEARAKPRSEMALAFFESLGVSPTGWSVIKGMDATTVFDENGRDVSANKSNPSLIGTAWTSSGLVNSAGTVTVPALRRADETWVRSGTDYAAASDGSAAIIDGLLDRDNPQHVTVFSNKGVPLQTFKVDCDLMNGKIAFDGHVVVVTYKEEIRAFSTTGSPLWKAKIPGGQGAFIRGLSIFNGRLYTLDEKQQILTYAMP